MRPRYDAVSSAPCSFVSLWHKHHDSEAISIREHHYDSNVTQAERNDKRQRPEGKFVLERHTGTSSKTHCHVHAATHFQTCVAYTRACHAHFQTGMSATYTQTSTHTHTHKHTNMFAFLNQRSKGKTQPITLAHAHSHTHKQTQWCKPTASNWTSAERNISILSGFQSRLHQLFTQPTCSRA